ncbi:DUF6090 family protein [uncultured Draconibacterium sp.]|uniref:DUF6090 family protein n=1 Tax=uncultured Draconibacterium sp. TaxID=1573823 RepID=UPI0029C9599E|nr:DUF6090 family protein [uncultured Draconibacterium sp.]
MTRFFRHIQFRFGTEKKFSAYLIYAAGEIFLLVIGILLALQINNWNSNRKDREAATKAYQNISQQLTEDRNELISVRDFNNYYSTRYERASELIAGHAAEKTDSIAILIMELSQYSDFHRSENIYETLVNSGSIKLLKNSNITSALQKLEMTYTSINKLEDIHWEIILNELYPEIRGVINYATLEIVKPDRLSSVEIQNFLVESIYLTKAKELVYNKAINEIDTLGDEIAKELNHKN